MKCIDSAEIYQLTIGVIDNDRMAALEHHFSHCAKCASTREEVLNIVGRLAPQDSEFDDNQLANRVMKLIQLDHVPLKVPKASWWTPFPLKWQRWVAAPLVLATTAALIFFVWPKADLFDSKPFQARGVFDNPDQWVSIQIYRSGTNNTYHPISSSSLITTDDVLSFSYSNRAKGQYQYLMILAVDQSGRIFWYYPAYNNEGENPTSIPISTSDKPLLLPEQVRHELKLGPLRIFGLFSETPLDAHTVELLISRDLKAIRSIEKLSRLNLSKTGQHSLLLQVKLSLK